MIDPRAEQSFRSGKRLLDAGSHREAVAFFKAALEFEANDKNRRPQGRYLSYYGLSLCLTRTGLRDALRYCRTAAAQENDRPEVWWNLGRVALALGRRGEAYRALERGLCLQPEHGGIRTELRRLGVRRTPVLSFLPRQHPINVAMGRIRSRIEKPGSWRKATRRSAGSAKTARIDKVRVSS